MYKLSKYAVFSEPFYEKGSTQGMQIIFSGLSSEAGIFHPAIVDFINEGSFSKIPKVVLDELLKIKAIQLINEHEPSLVLNENLESSRGEKVLYQVIQPSAWCQMACGYCGQKHEKKQLPESDVALLYSIINKKIDKNSYTDLHIGWFGGEPLTALKKIYQMSEKLMDIAQQNNLSYSAKVVTNGVALTKKVFQRLSNDCAVNHYEITLDGPASVHDVTRPLKNSKTSFKQIIKNLTEISTLQPQALITIRVNVGMVNHDAIPELIEVLHQQGLQQTIKLYFAPIHDWGNDASKQSLSMQAFSQSELVWYSMLIERGFRVGLLPNRKKVVCMSLSPQAEVFDAYGDIFDCSEMSQVSEYGQPNRYRLGRLSQPMLRDSRRFSDFNQKIVDGETSCHDCYCLPLCGGACPKSWSEGKVPCPPYKYNLPQRLLLQYAVQRTNNVGQTQCQ